MRSSSSEHNPIELGLKALLQDLTSNAHASRQKHFKIFQHHALELMRKYANDRLYVPLLEIPGVKQCFNSLAAGAVKNILNDALVVFNHTLNPVPTGALQKIEYAVQRLKDCLDEKNTLLVAECYREYKRAVFINKKVLEKQVEDLIDELEEHPEYDDGLDAKILIQLAKDKLQKLYIKREKIEAREFVSPPSSVDKLIRWAFPTLPLGHLNKMNIEITRLKKFQLQLETKQEAKIALTLLTTESSEVFAQRSLAQQIKQLDALILHLEAAKIKFAAYEREKINRDGLSGWTEFRLGCSMLYSGFRRKVAHSPVDKTKHLLARERCAEREQAMLAFRREKLIIIREAGAKIEKTKTSAAIALSLLTTEGKTVHECLRDFMDVSKKDLINNVKELDAALNTANNLEIKAKECKKAFFEDSTYYDGSSLKATFDEVRIGMPIRLSRLSRLSA